MLEQKIFEANAFWNRARAYVLEIARDIGVRIEIAEHDDGFLFDLFDGGDSVPLRGEVIEAIQELKWED